MTKINDGGAAFPLHPGILPDWDQSNGMTLRDYFAAKMVSVAILERPIPTPRDSWQGGRLSRSSPAYKREMDEWRRELAEAAFLHADAMLAERERGQ